jgi:CO/xanthine dehydrogenase FAD-binding subunit
VPVATINRPDYFRPAALTDALAYLQQNPHAQVLAGGTDWYAARVGRPVHTGALLDVTNIAELKSQLIGADGLRLGAGLTWAQVQQEPLATRLPVLAQAAREVGAWQVQHRATLGGNLVNASPAADGVVALMSLDATLELQSAAGTRLIPLDKFILGPKNTALKTNELLVAIHIPFENACCSAFIKLGSRASLVISFVMVAVHLRLQADVIAQANIVVGACSPVAMRLPLIEQSLVGLPVQDLDLWVDSLGQQPIGLEGLRPIDDVRASAGYRQEVAAELVGRAIKAAVRGNHAA